LARRISSRKEPSPIPKAFQNHLIKGEGEGVFVGGMGMYLRVQN